MEYNMRGWTDLKESKVLVSAGLKPETADMHHCEGEEWYDTALCYDKDDSESDKYVPCWSYGRLIDLMPKRIGLFTLIWNISGGVIEYKVDIDSEHTDRLVSKFDIPSMVVWLLENGYMEDYKVLEYLEYFSND